MPDDVALSTVGQRLARVLGAPSGRPAALTADVTAGRGGVAGGPVPRWRGPAGPPDRVTVHPAADGSPPVTGGASAEPVTGDPSAGVVAGEGVVGRLGGAVTAFDPGRPGLRVLAVVALVVGLVAAGVAWWSRPDPEPVAPRLAGTAPEAVVTSAPVELVVAVSGKVHRPGLVRLPPGARVADAIEAAGGALPEAELDQLNLARKVTDGELIAVGVPPPPDPAGAPGGGPLNLNTATAAQLETLPGIGPALAQRIIDYRTAHGPFTSVGQLREVPGIGEARFAELEPLVTV